MKNNTIQVTDITHREPGNNLPKFVREAAEKRGYGDSIQPLSLYVQEADINEAFACAAQGNGSACVMAQAGKRIGAQAIYFYRTTVWVDFGAGPIVRFCCSKQIYQNIIAPFDRGDREAVLPGIYHLTPPGNAHSLSAMRKRAETNSPPRGKNTNGSHSTIGAHMERVVMAAQV